MVVCPGNLWKVSRGKSFKVLRQKSFSFVLWLIQYLEEACRKSDHLDTFGSSGHFSFPPHTFQTIWTLFRLSGHWKTSTDFPVIWPLVRPSWSFLDEPNNFLIFQTPSKNFLDLEKNSGQHCWRAEGVFLTLWSPWL